MFIGVDKYCVTVEESVKLSRRSIPELRNNCPPVKPIRCLMDAFNE